METKLFLRSLIILACALPLMAQETTRYPEIESITGTREPDEDSVTDTRHSHEETTTEINAAIATTTQSSRQSRWYRPAGRADSMMDDHDDHDDHMVWDHDDVPEMKSEMAQPKADYWGGYYDFLINEGSYKFWAVFQLGTAALLIYSGFAALYYAKVNPSTDDDYGDYILRRRRSADQPPRDRTFLGLSPETFQRIIDAIAQEFH